MQLFVGTSFLKTAIQFQLFQSGRSDSLWHCLFIVQCWQMIKSFASPFRWILMIYSSLRGFTVFPRRKLWWRGDSNLVLHSSFVTHGKKKISSHLSTIFKGEDAYFWCGGGVLWQYWSCMTFFYHALLRKDLVLLPELTRSTSAEDLLTQPRFTTKLSNPSRSGVVYGNSWLILLLQMPILRPLIS